MLPIEEVKKWLVENRTDENGNLNLSGLDFSDFDGDVLIGDMKVKKSLNQSWQKVGGDLRQNYQEAGGRKFYDFGSLNADFRKVSPAERGELIIQLFGEDDGKIHIEDVDLSDFGGHVAISSWKVGRDLFLDHQEVGGNLYQNHQEVKGDLYQDYQEVEGSLHQGNQQAGWVGQAAEGAIYQGNQKAGARVYQDPDQGKKPLTPKDKGQFLLKYFKNERGDLELNDVDLSDFHGDVEPDYKAEYERLKKEICEADRKIETLMWVLMKIKEEAK